MRFSTLTPNHEAEVRAGALPDAEEVLNRGRRWRRGLDRRFGTRDPALEPVGDEEAFLMDVDRTRKVFANEGLEFRDAERPWRTAETPLQEVSELCPRQLIPGASWSRSRTVEAMAEGDISQPQTLQRAVYLLWVPARL